MRKILTSLLFVLLTGCVIDISDMTRQELSQLVNLDAYSSNRYTFFSYRRQSDLIYSLIRSDSLKQLQEQVQDFSSTLTLKPDVYEIHGDLNQSTYMDGCPEPGYIPNNQTNRPPNEDENVNYEVKIDLDDFKESTCSKKDTAEDKGILVNDKTYYYALRIRNRTGVFVFYSSIITVTPRPIEPPDPVLFYAGIVDPATTNGMTVGFKFVSNLSSVPVIDPDDGMIEFNLYSSPISRDTTSALFCDYINNLTCDYTKPDGSKVNLRRGFIKDVFDVLAPNYEVSVLDSMTRFNNKEIYGIEVATEGTPNVSLPLYYTLEAINSFGSSIMLEPSILEVNVERFDLDVATGDESISITRSSTPLFEAIDINGDPILLEPVAYDLYYNEVFADLDNNSKNFAASKILELDQTDGLQNNVGYWLKVVANYDVFGEDFYRISYIVKATPSAPLLPIFKKVAFKGWTEASINDDAASMDFLTTVYPSYATQEARDISLIYEHFSSIDAQADCDYLTDTSCQNRKLENVQPWTESTNSGTKLSYNDLFLSPYDNFVAYPPNHLNFVKQEVYMIAQAKTAVRTPILSEEIGLKRFEATVQSYRLGADWKIDLRWDHQLLYTMPVTPDGNTPTNQDIDYKIYIMGPPGVETDVALDPSFVEDDVYKPGSQLDNSVNYSVIPFTCLVTDSSCKVVISQADLTASKVLLEDAKHYFIKIVAEADINNDSTDNYAVSYIYKITLKDRPPVPTFDIFHTEYTEAVSNEFEMTLVATPVQENISTNFNELFYRLYQTDLPLEDANNPGSYCDFTSMVPDNSPGQGGDDSDTAGDPDFALCNNVSPTERGANLPGIDTIETINVTDARPQYFNLAILNEFGGSQALEIELKEPFELKVNQISLSDAFLEWKDQFQLVDPELMVDLTPVEYRLYISSTEADIDLAIPIVIPTVNATNLTYTFSPLPTQSTFFKLVTVFDYDDQQSGPPSRPVELYRISEIVRMPFKTIPVIPEIKPDPNSPGPLGRDGLQFVLDSYKSRLFVTEKAPHYKTSLPSTLQVGLYVKWVSNYLPDFGDAQYDLVITDASWSPAACPTTSLYSYSLLDTATEPPPTLPDDPLTKLIVDAIEGNTEYFSTIRAKNSLGEVCSDEVNFVGPPLEPQLDYASVEVLPTGALKFDLINLTSAGTLPFSDYDYYVYAYKNAWALPDTLSQCDFLSHPPDASKCDALEEIVSSFVPATGTEIINYTIPASVYEYHFYVTPVAKLDKDKMTAHEIKSSTLKEVFQVKDEISVGVGFPAIIGSETLIRITSPDTRGKPAGAEINWPALPDDLTGNATCNPVKLKSIYLANIQVTDFTVCDFLGGNPNAACYDWSKTFSPLATSPTSIDTTSLAKGKYYAYSIYEDACFASPHYGREVTIAVGAPKQLILSGVQEKLGSVLAWNDVDIPGDSPAGDARYVLYRFPTGDVPSARDIQLGKPVSCNYLIHEPGTINVDANCTNYLVTSNPVTIRNILDTKIAIESDYIVTAFNSYNTGIQATYSNVVTLKPHSSKITLKATLEANVNAHDYRIESDPLDIENDLPQDYYVAWRLIDTTASGYPCTINDYPKEGDKNDCLFDSAIDAMFNTPDFQQGLDFDMIDLPAQHSAYRFAIEVYHEDPNSGMQTPQYYTNLVKTAGKIDFVEKNGIRVGYDHGCFIANAAMNADIYCWGDNDFGQQGDGTKINKYDPLIATPVEDPSGAILHDFKKLSSGYKYSCAINSTDDLYCWGKNQELGPNGSNLVSGKAGKVATDPNPQEVLSATLVDSNYIDATKDAVIDVATGFGSTCAIVADKPNKPETSHTIRCWGANMNGEVTPDGKMIPSYSEGSSYNDITALHTDFPDIVNFIPMSITLNISEFIPIACSTGYLSTDIAQKRYTVCWGNPSATITDPLSSTTYNNNILDATNSDHLQKIEGLDSQEQNPTNQDAIASQAESAKLVGANFSIPQDGLLSVGENFACAVVEGTQEASVNPTIANNFIPTTDISYNNKDSIVCWGSNYYLNAYRLGFDGDGTSYYYSCFNQNIGGAGAPDMKTLVVENPKDIEGCSVSLIGAQKNAYYMFQIGGGFSSRIPGITDLTINSTMPQKITGLLFEENYPLDGKVTAVSSGYLHTCVRLEYPNEIPPYEAAACWGSNFGITGNSITNAPLISPYLIAGNEPIIKNLSYLTDKIMFEFSPVFSASTFGPYLMRPDTSSFLSPVFFRDVVAVHANYYNTCLATAGSLMCIGDGVKDNSVDEYSEIYY